MKVKTCTMVAAVVVSSLALIAGGAWGAVTSSPGPVETAAEQQIQAVRDTIADALWTKTDEYWHGADQKEGSAPGDTSPMLNLCAMVIELDPQYAEAYSVAAWLSLGEGKERQALNFYQRGLELNPDSYELAQALGYEYYVRRKHDPQAALPYLKRAAELPSPIGTKRLYGHVLTSAGKYEEAAAQWRKLLQQHPGDPIATKELAKLRASGKIAKEQ